MSSTDFLHTGVSRRTVLAGGLALGASTVMSPYNALASQPGDMRRINIYNPRADEYLDTIYYANGAYVPDAMQSINKILRDIHSDTVTDMDPRLIDIVSAVQYLLGHDRPFSVISGYRTRATNNALRRKSRGVAKNSYHIKGMAVDLRMEGVDVDDIVRAGKTLDSGGVGIYRRRKFVHLDSGPVRTWKG